MPEEFRPLKDLVNTYLPDEAMKTKPTKPLVCKCCGEKIPSDSLSVNKEQCYCGACLWRDKFL
jgi:formylmethanofuran dehydrogenase subunit E